MPRELKASTVCKKSLMCVCWQEQMELGNGGAQIMTMRCFHCKTLEDDVQSNVVKCC